LAREHTVLSISDYVQLYAERIPEDEIPHPPEETEFIHVIHFQNEPQKAHGVPFKFRLISVSQEILALCHIIDSVQDEKFSDTKKRLEKRTGLKGKNFEKIKFAVVRRSAYGKPTYLTDGRSIDISHLMIYC